VLETLFGSKNAERVLMFIFAREEGYAREITQYYQTDLKPIQNQLEKFEGGGILVSRQVGRTRPYQLNPRYYFLSELKALLDKSLSAYPQDEQEKLRMNRRRPRGRGKEL
jgi:predicted transcriptional regulator